MAGENTRDGNEEVPRTGVNDHAWEREHKYPTRAQQLAMGYRRRAAEAKPGQHLEEARRKSEEEQDTGAQVVSR